MIGGLAWPSTNDYYRIICTMANRHFADLGYDDPLPTPPMSIESVDISVTRKLRGNNDDPGSWAAFEDYFRNLLSALESAGVDFAFIASNTPHMRLDGIVKGSRLPVNSILDATASALQDCGSDRALVLGTPVTMRAAAYPAALTRHNIEAFTLTNDTEVSELARLIDIDIYAGDTESTRAWMMSMGKREQKRSGIDTVCLACTELPLAFPEHADDVEFEIDGLRYLNTTNAHARSVFLQAMQD